jgi:hypothetical protein
MPALIFEKLQKDSFSVKKSCTDIPGKDIASRQIQ